LGRGGRVVAETASRSGTGGLAARRASTVVLPEPEGPETTISLPDGGMEG
jgi:hypothetical protein